ncbi:MAG: hypothetical protein ACO3ZG_03815, partial [Kiritimatiellia bacterium]
RLEWLTRHLADDQKQASESLERGDRIATPQGKILADTATLRIDGLPDTLDTPLPPPQPSAPS